MKGKMKFGIAIPQAFPSGQIDLSIISGAVKQAEALGYESCWVQERVVGGLPTLDPIPLLSYAAAHCTRVRLGTSVMLTALRNPINLAKAVATLDQLCKGRVILGVGLGGGPALFPAFGLSSKTRVSRFEEGLRTMKTLWTEDEVSLNSRFWQMDGVTLNTKPYQKPHPPIWFGGHARDALRRAVRMGDGWMGAGNSSTAEFIEEKKLVRQILEEEGRDPETFAVSKRVYVAVDRDKSAAARMFQEWYGRHYGNAARGLVVPVFGSEEECVEGLGEVVSQGIDLLMLNTIDNHLEQAERLAKDVLPKL